MFSIYSYKERSLVVIWQNLAKLDIVLFETRFARQFASRNSERILWADRVALADTGQN